MKTFIYWLLNKAGLVSQLDELKLEQKVLKAQLNHLTECGNKAVRRKWKRILTNSRSPFYLFNK